MSKRVGPGRERETVGIQGEAGAEMEGNGGEQEEMKRDTDDKTKQGTDTLKREERHTRVLGGSTQMGRQGHRKERATHARKFKKGVTRGGHSVRQSRGGGNGENWVRTTAEITAPPPPVQGKPLFLDPQGPARPKDEI